MCLSRTHTHTCTHPPTHTHTQHTHTHTHAHTEYGHRCPCKVCVLVCSCLPIVSFNAIIYFCSILSTSASTAKRYIWFQQLAVCGVDRPISNFQGSVQREWCTRLSSHCAHHITTVSQHLSTAAKYSVQHCSGSHTHCDTAEGQQFCYQGIHYSTRCVGVPLVQKLQVAMQ